VLVLFKGLIEFSRESFRPLTFLSGRLFIAASISFHVMDLFRWLIASRFSFGWACVSTNLSFSSRLSNLLNIGFQSSP
jgi:hypothetical protein